MTEYRVPFQDAESEFTEKRSRFLSHLFRVESEAEARQRIEEMRKKYYDARHNCWCYLIEEGGIVRYSDDGEPQGTAGQPMLNVFQRREVWNVCCVVTRYFGGVLLGAGGRTRAYSQGARAVLDAAGSCRMGLWTLWDIPCPYALFERLRLEVEAGGGVLRSADYGAEILLHAAFPAGREGAFQARLTELSAGGIAMAKGGEEFLPGPRGGWAARKEYEARPAAKSRGAVLSRVSARRAGERRRISACGKGKEPGRHGVPAL